MFLSDVKYLIQCEAQGECVVSWYAKDVWDALKNQVRTQEDATRLSRVMRDNRFNAMIVLGHFMNMDGYLFLYHLLDLSYGDYTYTPKNISVKGDYVIATFNKEKCETQYGLEQKARKVRVAFESLRDYLDKSQRNGAMYITARDGTLLQTAITNAKSLSKGNRRIAAILSELLASRSMSEAALREVIRQMPDLKHDKNFVAARDAIQKLMARIGTGLASNWTSDRYCRDMNYDQNFSS